MVKAPRRRVGPRSLGQNFLVDRNILSVIERLAALSGDDVVLEIGGGLGVLSERLATAAGWLHVIEVDERLLSDLGATLAPFPQALLHAGDAVEFDYAALHPAPTKVVANLPYSVAATVVLRTIDELPSVGQWVVMVQREVGERLAAAPGDRVYGIPSVLAQLACDVRVLRPIARTVFRPVPNVDSVLLGLTRRCLDPLDPDLRRLVHDAFAHRRKALAGSLALAPGAVPGVRDRAREALAELGFPRDVRAERLSAEDFRALSRKLA
jgi:16S rRNA (adenine1518-N6/adenine1519-N6)-dimethyltransferase